MKKGFSLIEVMLYIAVISLIFGVFAALGISVSRSYARLALARNMDVAAITVMERLTRSVRAASSVDTAGSILSSNPGALSLNQVTAEGVTVKILFQVAGQNIQVKVDGVDKGTLLPDGVTVSELIFNSMNSSTSAAVRVKMRLDGRVGAATSSEIYYDTVVLRGSYR